MKILTFNLEGAGSNLGRDSKGFKFFLDYP